jgi:hypothetical protein
MSLLLARQTPPPSSEVVFALAVAPEALARGRGPSAAEGASVAQAFGPIAQVTAPEALGPERIARKERPLRESTASVIVPAVAAFVLQVPTATGPERFALPGLRTSIQELFASPTPQTEEEALATGEAPVRTVGIPGVRVATEQGSAGPLTPFVAAFVLEVPTAEAPAWIPARGFRAFEEWQLATPTPQAEATTDVFVPGASGPVFVARPGRAALQALAAAPTPSAPITLATADGPVRIAARAGALGSSAGTLTPDVAAFVLEVPSVTAPWRFERRGLLVAAQDQQAGPFGPDVAAFVLEVPTATGPERFAAPGVCAALQVLAMAPTPPASITLAMADCPVRLAVQAGALGSTATVLTPDVAAFVLEVPSVTAPWRFERRGLLVAAQDQQAGPFGPDVAAFVLEQLSVAAPSWLGSASSDRVEREVLALGLFAESITSGFVNGSTDPELVPPRRRQDAFAWVQAPEEQTLAEAVSPDRTAIPSLRILDFEALGLGPEAADALCWASFPDRLTAARRTSAETESLPLAPADQTLASAVAPSELARQRPLQSELGWSAPVADDRTLAGTSYPDALFPHVVRRAEPFGSGMIAEVAGATLLPSFPDWIARASRHAAFEPYEAGSVLPPLPPLPPIAPRVPAVIAFQSPGVGIGGAGGLGVSWIQMPPASCEEPEQQDVLDRHEDVGPTLQALLDHAEKKFLEEDADARGFARGQRLGIALAFASRFELDRERELRRASEERASDMEAKFRANAASSAVRILEPEPEPVSCEPVFIPAETWPIEPAPEGWQPLGDPDLPPPEQEPRPRSTWVYWALAGAAIALAVALWPSDPEPPPKPPPRRPVRKSKKRRRARIRRS